MSSLRTSLLFFFQQLNKDFLETKNEANRSLHINNF